MKGRFEGVTDVVRETVVGSPLSNLVEFFLLIGGVAKELSGIPSQVSFERIELMVQVKPKLTKKTIILPLIGILAFFLYIYLFNVDLLSVLRTAQSAQPLPYLAAVLVSFLEIFFYALSWNALLRGVKVKLALLKAYIFVWYATFLDILIPAESVSGEICRVYLVNREQCGTSGRVMASLMTFRLLSMVMNSAFLLLGAALLFGSAQINPMVFNVIQFLVGSIVFFMVLLIAVSWKENWSLKIINSVVRVGEFVCRGRWNLEKVRRTASNAAEMFHSSMKDVIRNPGMLVAPAFYLFLNWVAAMSIPYLVFLSLGYEVSWGVIFVTTSIVVAIKSIPVGIPFEVGLPEIAMTTLYAAGGVPAGIAATSTILSRIVTLWLRFGAGFVAFQWTEIKAGSLNRPNSQGNMPLVDGFN